MAGAFLDLGDVGVAGAGVDLVQVHGPGGHLHLRDGHEVALVVVDGLEVGDIAHGAVGGHHGGHLRRRAGLPHERAHALQVAELDLACAVDDDVRQPLVGPDRARWGRT